MIKITKNIVLNESELKISFTRSSGPGGQNVNKVASAAQLRFNILLSSSLSEEVKNRLLALIHHKITQEGEFIIKADRYRTQERNKHDAIERLITLIRKAATPIKKRKKTKPTKASIERRLEKKKVHAKTKKLRQKPSF